MVNVIGGTWKALFLGAVAAALTVSVGCKKGETTSAAAGGSSAGTAKIKLGYLVKQPDEPWFQTEWQFAQKAADENNVELIKLATQDGEKVLSAIDNLSAQGAKGFVICTPDVKLGPAIVKKAADANLKLITVDDQFIGSDGKIMADVHHLGVAARDVGHVAGTSLAEQLKERKWPVEQTGLLLITFEELDTARERTEGIAESLVASGFPKDHIYKSPERTTDIPGALDAATITITQHPEVKYWLLGGMNDSAVLGAVRAVEGRGFTVDNAVGIGINGTDCIDELKKTKPTPFYGSILMEANVHGHDTTVALYNWVTKGEEPPKTRFTGGVLITRADFEQKLKEHGMWR
jgi:L-arabinose transport system substrate-binding protein